MKIYVLKSNINSYYSYSLRSISKKSLRLYVNVVFLAFQCFLKMFYIPKIISLKSHILVKTQFVENIHRKMSMYSKMETQD